MPGVACCSLLVVGCVFVDCRCWLLLLCCCCSSCVARCLFVAGHCLLLVVIWLLFVACRVCFLIVVFGVACCSWFVVGCWLLFVVFAWLFGARCLLFVVVCCCGLLYVAVSFVVV